MGFFSRIMDRLRQQSPSPGSSPASAGQPEARQSSSAPPGSRIAQQQTQDMAIPAGMPLDAPAPEGQPPVDVDAVLTRLAAQKGGGNWRTSIVDLLKLLDLDSSLAARKELAGELGVRAGEHGSAEQNIALHKALMRAIAANGGKVPDSLKD